MNKEYLDNSIRTKIERLITRPDPCKENFFDEVVEDGNKQIDICVKNIKDALCEEKQQIVLQELEYIIETLSTSYKLMLNYYEDVQINDTVSYISYKDLQRSFNDD